MKLKKLEIKNFRGIKDLTLDFKPQTNSIAGKNGIGKTSVIDSIMWLLCDETYVYGKTNEDNKNKNDHTATIYIKGVFEKNDGKVLELERTYFEKWKDNEFDKIENQFKVNGTKHKANEYFERIRNEIGIKYNTKVKNFNLLRCLIDVNYLDDIDYKVARKFVEEILDLTSDEEIASKDQYKLIRETLVNNNYDLDKSKAYFNEIKQNAENEINKLENEINLLESFLIENEEEKRNELNQEYTKLGENTAEKVNAINNDYADKISEKNAIISEIKAEYDNKLAELDKGLNECIQVGNKLNGVMQELHAKQEDLRLLNTTDEHNVRFTEQALHETTQLIEKEKKASFVEYKCPECGCVLNETDRVEFDKEKKHNLERYKGKLAEGKANIEKFNENINSRNKEIETLQVELDNAVNEFEQKRLEYQTLQDKRSEMVALLNTTGIEQINGEIKALENEKQAKLEALQDEIAVEREKLNKRNYDLDNSINNRNYIKTKQNQVAEMKKVKASAEIRVDILTQFKQEKLQLTRENTKKVFPNIEFEMLEISQTTGAIQECCHATYNNVEFGGLNNGSKYLVGIEVIENIKSALNVTDDLPIIFDRKADIDKDNYAKLRTLTNAQLINTLVANNEQIEIRGE